MNTFSEGGASDGENSGVVIGAGVTGFSDTASGAGVGSIGFDDSVTGAGAGGVTDLCVKKPLPLVGFGLRVEFVEEMDPPPFRKNRRLRFERCRSHRWCIFCCSTASSNISISSPSPFEITSVNAMESPIIPFGCCLEPFAFRRLPVKSSTASKVSMSVAPTKQRFRNPKRQQLANILTR